jgi:hypothetical protein
MKVDRNYALCNFTEQFVVTTLLELLCVPRTTACDGIEGVSEGEGTAWKQSFWRGTEHLSVTS